MVSVEINYQERRDGGHLILKIKNKDFIEAIVTGRDRQMQMNIYFLHILEA